MKQTFFKDVNDLIAYLYTKIDSRLSPLKLQKGLYFLYAYYSAMYGSTLDDEEAEITYDLPRELFPAEFEAWNYGPVIRSVYIERKAGEEKYQEMARKFDSNQFFNSDSKKEVQSFIDDLFAQINRTSDFSLVDKCHEDKAWENTFSKGKSTIIPNEAIINEYGIKFSKRA